MLYAHNAKEGKWNMERLFFKTDEIPSIQEIKDLINLKNQLKYIKKWKI